MYRRINSLLLILFFAFTPKVFGQSLPGAKHPGPSRNIDRSDEFVDGKTIIDGVLFTGVDSDDSDLDPEINNPSICLTSHANSVKTGLLSNPTTHLVPGQQKEL
jgi:hypothetical protein